MAFRNTIFALGSLLLASHASSATTFYVTTTADSGAGSLRAAITSANNAGAGPHTIAFNIASGSLTGPFGSKRALIALASPLPAITVAGVTIDGLTQTTFGGDTNTGTMGTTTTVGIDGTSVAALPRPEVELSLPNSLSSTSALLIIQAANCTVQGLALHGGGDASNGGGGDRRAGILLDSNTATGSNANGFTITQCVVGSTALSFSYPSDGTQCAVYGICVGGTTGTGIGGTISNSLIGFTGNSGVFVINSTTTAKVTITGCQFNQNGFNVNGGDAITLGGSAALKVGPVDITGNLITAPNSSGVQLEIGSTNATTIRNNSFLSCGLGGASANSLEGSAICYLARNNPAGANTGNAGDVINKNIIQDSEASGIVVGYGQKGVQISQNVIYGNGKLSIDLIDNSTFTTANGSTYGDGDGVTPNRNQGTGYSATYSPNGGLDYPIFTKALLTGTTLTVEGYVGTAAGQATFQGATVEIFKAAAHTNGTTNGAVVVGDGKTEGHGELGAYLGTLTADATGNFSGSFTVRNLVKGNFVSGTAWLAGRGTSEASNLLTVTATQVPVAVDVLNATLQNTAARTALAARLTASTPTSGATITSFTITSLPAAASGTLYYDNGTRIVPATVGLSIPVANAGNLSFDPATGYSGNALVGYSATDSNGKTSDDNATLTIPVNAPPVANNVTTGTVASTTATAAAIKPLSGTDSDGTVTSYTITTVPKSGTLTYSNGGTITNLAVGTTITYAQASTLAYTPVAGYNGQLTFTYAATDNDAGVSAAAIYTIPVGTGNSATANATPTATNVTNASMPADARNSALAALAGADSDGTVAGFTIKTLPASGTLYFNGEVAKVGTLVLASRANLLSYTPGSQGSYTFTYTATDNQDAESTSAATFTIPVAAPLPVVLVSFEAQRSAAGAALTWITASEKDSDFFAVESSADGKAFSEVGRVASHGTTSQSHTYRFTDANLNRYGAAVVYYRLRQADLDGTVTYSPVRTVAVAAAERTSLTAQVYPNPAPAASVQLAIMAPAAGTATLTATDALGRPVLTRTLNLTAGTNSVEVPEAAQWGRGLYQLRVVQPGATQTLKLVRE